jgi:predicted KAP-like P-loop ATPase
MPGLSHNDDPTDSDELGREKFIARLSNIVRNCDPPKGIAVSGYWGTGKTSALRQLQKHLEPDGKKKGPVVTVWFEAWRYQHEAQPVVGLLHEIRTRLRMKGRFKNEAEKITNVTFHGLLSAFDGAIKAISLGSLDPKLGQIPELGQRWEAANYATLLTTETLRELLDAAIGEALEKNGRLVVLIDDLDRCEGANVLRLLEGIKIYLNLRRCVVVFALDYRQVVDALTGALGAGDTDEEGRRRGYTARDRAREYLEKICQDIHQLPLPTAAQKGDLLLSYVDQIVDVLPVELVGVTCLVVFGPVET